MYPAQREAADKDDQILRLQAELEAELAARSMEQSAWRMTHQDVEAHAAALQGALTSQGTEATGKIRAKLQEAEAAGHRAAEALAERGIAVGDLMREREEGRLKDIVRSMQVNKLQGLTESLEARRRQLENSIAASQHWQREYALLSVNDPTKVAEVLARQCPESLHRCELMRGGEAMARSPQPSHEEVLEGWCEHKKRQMAARLITPSPAGGSATVMDGDGAVLSPVAMVTGKPSARAILSNSGAEGLKSYLDVHVDSPFRIREEMRSIRLLRGDFEAF